MMKLKLLTLFVVAALVVCQASAVDLIEETVATWDGEVLTLTPWFNGSVSVVSGEVDHVFIDTTTTPGSAIVTIERSEKYVFNGDLDPAYRSAGVGNHTYPQPVSGWLDYQMSKNADCMRIYTPDPLGGGKYEGSFATNIPSGPQCLLVYTRYHNGYDGYFGGTDAEVSPLDYKFGYPQYFPRPEEAACQFVPYVTFDPEVPITLSAMVGRFLNATGAQPWNGYALQIAVGGEVVNQQALVDLTGSMRQHVAGGTVIAEYDVPATAGPIEGEWEAASVTYDATDPAAFAGHTGKPIQIRLVVKEDPINDPNFATSFYAAFDDITVEVGGETVMADTPNPVLTARTQQSWDQPVYSWNITSYDDACEMSRAIGTLEGDLNGDCEVNLVDLAILSETWLALPETTSVVIP